MRGRVSGGAIAFVQSCLRGWGGGSECGVVRGGECEWGCNRICTMVSERG